MDCHIGYKRDDRELTIVLPHYSLLTRELNHGDAVQIVADVIDDGEGKLRLDSPLHIIGLLVDGGVLEITGIDQGSIDNLIEFHRRNPSGRCNFLWANPSELSDELFVVMGY